MLKNLTDDDVEKLSKGWQRLQRLKRKAKVKVLRASLNEVKANSMSLTEIV